MSAEQPGHIPEEELEATEPLLPDGRTIADFPVDTEVVVYIMNYGNRELRRGTVTGHTEHGSVVVTPETMNRGLSWGKSPLGNQNPALPKFRPGSPGLLRREELQALQGAPDDVDAWVQKGDTYKDVGRRRLADKIRTYSGIEGPPVRNDDPGPRRRSRGVRKFSANPNNG